MTGRPKWKRNKPDSIASDKVNRVFGRTGPTQLWVTDITHPTREGKVYCCVVLDTYSRRVMGWSIDASPTAALVTNALGMAIDSRLGKTASAGTVIHSDQGVQFGSWAFTDLRRHPGGLVPSIGSVGDCYDDRCSKPRDLAQPASASQLGWLTPMEFERINTITVA